MSLISYSNIGSESPRVLSFLGRNDLFTFMVCQKKSRLDVEQLFRYHHFPLLEVIRDRVDHLLNFTQEAIGRILQRIFIPEQIHLSQMPGRDLVSLYQMYPRSQIEQFCSADTNPIEQGLKEVEIQKMALGMIAAGEISRAYELLCHPLIATDLLIQGSLKESFIEAFNGMRADEVVRILSKDPLLRCRDIFLQQRIVSCIPVIEEDDVMLLSSAIRDQSMRDRVLVSYIVSVDWPVPDRMTLLIQDPRSIAELADALSIKGQIPLSERLNTVQQLASAEGRDPIFFDLVMTRFGFMSINRGKYNDALAAMNCIQIPEMREGNKLSISRTCRAEQGMQKWVAWWQSHDCDEGLNFFKMPMPKASLPEALIDMIL